MNMDKIPVGDNPPWDINVIIEVPMGGEPVKYEMDKESGALFVDRFLHTSMHYPGHYGFIPHTLSGDGDPADVMVVGRRALIPGSVIPSRPIGVLMMEDDGGQDEKILAVPSPNLHPYHDAIKTYTDLPKVQLEQIRHFFEHYKDLEDGKWSKIIGWKDHEAAAEMISEAIERYNQQSNAA